ncbi:MAG TPA: nickel pincer cofactor biosynthesis protein LarC [Tissierellia bacterium]|nr:nickel pincer cofactor biosynthesis protein LarC [Tissierellia bacterium]
MKTLYIECNMGAAGDMLMGALLELHPDPADFIDRLNRLGIPGVEIKAEQSAKQGIVGTNIRVIVNGEEEHSRDYHHEHSHDHHHPHDHSHEHDTGHHLEARVDQPEYSEEVQSPADQDTPDDHSHDHDTGYHLEPNVDQPDYEDHHHDLSTLPSVTKIISELTLPDSIKQAAIGVYQLIAQAEARSHGREVAQVHFHEVGALDAVTDIVGNSLLIDELEVDRIVVSPIHVGSGMVKCAHGILPVPAPATAHILQGVPTYGGEIRGELCTPTGAAILKYFADDFGPQPIMRVEKIGHGMGKKDFAAANMVRVFLGESKDEPDTITELSCNIDDMTGEEFGHVFDLLFEAGALDVYLTPIQMKKHRPGIMLRCLCRSDQADDMAKLILRHTSTFGIRRASFERYTLDREIIREETSFGMIRVKTGTGYGIKKTKPEYDDLQSLADQHNISLREMRQKIEQELYQTETGGGTNE